MKLGIENKIFGYSVKRHESMWLEGIVPFNCLIFTILRFSHLSFKGEQDLSFCRENYPYNPFIMG
jgi:hypothetical protein